MTLVELLTRARSVAGKGIGYRLGAGGINALAKSPANTTNECDCSGYVCWALGLSRVSKHPLYLQFNGGWINTDGMCHDGERMAGFFELLAAPKPGALIIYPGSKKGVGHVGIVTAAEGGAAKKVIHCSAGNFRKNHDAICETGPDVFRRPDVRFLWFCGLS
jgi:cell wall-associated NlpC family hydrolase